MLLKPKDAEGRVFLTQKQLAKKRRELFNAQFGICAECNKMMIWEMGFLNSATIDHIKPQPAGCFKDSRDENLRCICQVCNHLKGSKR